MSLPTDHELPWARAYIHGRNPRGDRGDDPPPQNFGRGDDIAHIPTINYPHSYDKLPFAWIIGFIVYFKETKRKSFFLIIVLYLKVRIF